MRPPTSLLILVLVVLVPKTIGTKREKDEGNNDYIKLSHDQSGKLKTFDSLPIMNPRVNAVILK